MGMIPGRPDHKVLACRIQGVMVNPLAPPGVAVRNGLYYCENRASVYWEKYSTDYYTQVYFGEFGTDIYASVLVPPYGSWRYFIKSWPEVYPTLPLTVPNVFQSDQLWTYGGTATLYWVGDDEDDPGDISFGNKLGMFAKPEDSRFEISGDGIKPTLRVARKDKSGTVYIKGA